MAGHSKWHSIQHKKGANDAARGKIFTKHAKLITIAARSGGDPDSNPALRMEIERAKAVNMPNNNIERAIKKGTGEDKDAAIMMELQYEGYAPAGVALLVDTITDNKNRTVTGVRTAFSKNGGNMGESGSVSWMFHRKGILTINNISAEKAEEIEMIAIELDAEDVAFENETLEITTDAKHLMSIKDEMEKQGISINSAEIAMVPENKIHISNIEDAKKILKLIEALEDDDDVSSVHSNADFDESVMKTLEEE
jgi:YebC/PmpR family DNA-binding regulatory protein